MDKLQELTDKLYKEGLSKGKEEGESIVNNAKKEAEDIIAKAKEEASKIIETANKNVNDLRVKVEGDLKMAASQSIQATKQDIETLIVHKMTDNDVTCSLNNKEFVETIIKAVAENFNNSQAQDIELTLPDSLKAELEPFVKNQLTKILDKGIEATFSKKIAGGFRIGPKDGSYFISFTDETFKELISAYLRPATKKLLFGEKL
jgi:hypothetical protein